MQSDYKVFFLALVFATSCSALFSSVCPPNDLWKGGCNVDPFLCKIVCEDGKDCGVSGDQCPIKSEDISKNEQPVTAEKCKTLCEGKGWEGDVAAQHCRFWRSETGMESHTCYFLNSDQCNYHKECNRPSCDCGDVGCPPDEEGGTTEPTTLSCPSGIEYHPGLAWIHWGCYNPDYPELSSPYNPDGNMYPDTVCYTTHKCADWKAEEERQLWLKCNGLTGTWIPDPTHPAVDPKNYDGVISSTEGLILEHECSDEPKDPLVVVIDDMGSNAQLSCETPDINPDSEATYTIIAPNKCVLLCDFQLGMIIEGRLNVEGDFKFYINDEKQPIGQDDVKSRIKCW